MLILIEKDSSTRIPKEVTAEEAAAFAVDFPVFVVNDDASTTSFSEWKADQVQSGTETGVDEAYTAAEAAAFEKSGLSASKWNKMRKADRDALIQAEMV